MAAQWRWLVAKTAKAPVLSLRGRGVAEHYGHFYRPTADGYSVILHTRDVRVGDVVPGEHGGLSAAKVSRVEEGPPKYIEWRIEK